MLPLALLLFAVFAGLTVFVCWRALERYGQAGPSGRRAPVGELVWALTYCGALPVAAILGLGSLVTLLLAFDALRS